MIYWRVVDQCVCVCVDLPCRKALLPHAPARCRRAHNALDLVDEAELPAVGGARLAALRGVHGGLAAKVGGGRHLQRGLDDGHAVGRGPGGEVDGLERGHGLVQPAVDNKVERVDVVARHVQELLRRGRGV